MWATPVPILVFLGLSVLDLGPMYVTDRRQTTSSLYAPCLLGAVHNIVYAAVCNLFPISVQIPCVSEKAVVTHLGLLYSLK